MELATAWRAQVRAAKRSLISGNDCAEPMEAPESLRNLRYWFLVPWTGRLAFAQTATKLRAGVAIALPQEIYGSASSGRIVGTGAALMGGQHRTLIQSEGGDDFFQILGICSACRAVPVFVSPDRLHEL